ncbi:MAG: GH1 family beta-glucosidase [Phycisphaerales bacterium]
MTTFPNDFVWGAATSAYQIEGGWNADGKGPSIWDAFTHDATPAGSVGHIPGQVFTPGNVFQNHTGDVGPDHYHRFAEDVGLMKQIGLRAYRFSVSWPRVVPAGDGRINAAGLSFYDRLVDALLAADITPWLTLFHWDMPLWAHHRGSWLNREIADWFADYAAAVVDRLSDRVRHWMTLNEPHIFLGPGEHEGLQCSNARKGHAERLLAAHHALLAHGRAAQVIRARARKPPQVGWAPIGRIKVPATSAPADIEAARAMTHAVARKDFWNNAWLADPVVLGRYPDDGLRLYGADAPRPHPGDMETIAQKLDFYGINVYDAELWRAGADGTPEQVQFPPGHPQNALRWFIIPEALYWGPKFLHERYKLPLVVTENGLSNLDWVDLDGKVRDPQRIDYTRRYLRELRRAASEGVPIRGYFHWSLLDNFEWQHGYKERFGLIHVDYATGSRTLKESAHWYRGIIESNGAAL